MSAKTASRRFARRAKQQFNPFKSVQPDKLSVPQPDPRQSNVERPITALSVNTSAAIAGNMANELILKLKLMHAENELHYAAIEAELTSALTSAGYHRIDRGPWRKVRGATSFLTPGTLPAPGRVPSPAAKRIKGEGEDAAGRGTEHLTPMLTARKEKCRRHIYELEELYQLSTVRARSKTAARFYARYLKRALNRAAAAEKSLATAQSIAQRESTKS